VFDLTESNAKAAQKKEVEATEERGREHSLEEVIDHD